MKDVVAYEYNMRLFCYAGDVAKNFGLFAKTIVRANYTATPDVFLVFSVNPIDENVNPTEIINRNKRNTHLFYPESFAVNINAENPLLVWDEISEYLRRAEFMCELYMEFQVPLPKKIRIEELDGLITFYCGRENPNYDLETRRNYAAGLREYFKQEISRGKLKKEWLDFYRSELYDGRKSFVQNFFVFLKRKEPETTIDRLLKTSRDLKKTYVSEHHYEEFRNIIKEKYPEVKYSVSDKRIVDKGIIVDPQTQLAVRTQFGLCVTDKQYDVVRERRFADEGFRCLDGLNLSRYEGRDLFYKASDENIIASVLNSIRYRWAKCSSIDVLRARGKIEKITIPVSQLGNIYVAMKEHNIPIVIDNDVNSNPRIDVVHVLYNSEDANIVGKLVAGITFANISVCHVSPENVGYDIDVDKVDVIINHAKEHAKELENIESFKQRDKNNKYLEI